MIRRDHPRLSLSRQCRFVAVSRSSLYHRPKGENAQNLGLMRRIDELFLEYPFYGSRQTVRHLWREGRETVHEQNTRWKRYKREIAGTWCTARKC